MKTKDDKHFGFQRFIRAIARVAFGVAFLPRVSGRENIPRAGGCIISCNHQNIVDPVVVATYSPRPLVFMSKKEVFDTPVLKWVVTWFRAFPVDRSRGDISAIRNALAVLGEAGCVLGIFPEGTRVRDAVLGPLEEGIGMIALRSGAPVVPARIGRYGFWSGMRVVFGKPINLDDLRGGRVSTERITEATRRIAKGMTDLA